jgi:hypothetical protein
MLAMLRPDLEEHAEWEEVGGRVAEVLERGTAAARYRHLLERTSDLELVTATAVAETAGEQT